MTFASLILATYLPFVVVQPGATFTTVSSNSFTGTDGVNLTSYTPDVGTNWVAWLGTMVLSNNAARVNADARYVQRTTSADVRITGGFTVGDTNGNYAPSVILRGSANGNFLQIAFNGNGTNSLNSRWGGTNEVIVRAAWPATTNSHTFEVLATGTWVTVSIDGVQTIASSNATMNAGGTYHGLMGFALAGKSDGFDGFKIATLDNQTVYPGGMNTVLVTNDWGGYTTGTNLSALGWTVQDGTWIVTNGAVVQTATSSPINAGATCVTNISVSDFAMRCQVTTPASGNWIVGLTACALNSTNILEWELNTHPTYNPGEGFGNWVKRAADAFVRIATSYFTPQSSTTYWLCVTKIGSRLISELHDISDTLLIRMEGVCPSDFILNTNHGMWLSVNNGDNITNLFDNITIKGVP